MPPLSWPDLLTEDLPVETTTACLAEWNFLLHGQFAVIGLSRFGDWYLRRPDGSTDELSVIEGTLTRLAETPEQFADLINQPDWQEEHLLSWLVAHLYEKQIIPAPGQCYGFTPHPALTGTLDPASATIFSITVWQSLCAQTFSSPRPD